MADNTVLNSGSGGDTIATEDRGTYKTPLSLIDVGGRTGSEAVIGDSGVAMPVRGLAAADAALSGNPVPIAARASAAAPTDMSADNDTAIPWVLRNGSFVVNMAVGGTLVTGSAGLPVAQQGTWTVGLSAGTNTNEIVGDVAHDAAIAGNPVTIGARASAAAPTDVSADDDAVRIWALRNGSPVVNLAAGGTLITATSSSINANITNASLTVASHAVTNAGTFVVQENGAALTALQVIDNPVVVDDAAFTPGTTSVMMAGFEADETSTDSVNEGDAGAARMTLDRKQIVTIQPHTAGGCSMFRSIDIDETEEDVKTSAGQIYGIHCMNLTNALLYLKFYNLTAGNCTVGTSTPVLTFPVPGNNDTDGAGFTFNLPQGIAFDTAICVACTTGVADADTGAPAANACVVNVFYM